MRFWLAAGTLCLVGWAHADEAVHRRGDYSFRVGAPPAFVEAAELPAQWDPAAPGATGATWRGWLYDRQVDRRGDAATAYIDYAYEPKSASLLGDAGKYQIAFNPGYQTLTIHGVSLRRDGRWQDRLDPEDVSLARRESGFERDMADGAVTALIVLDDVRVDDVVRIAYTIRGANPILAGQDSDTMYFAWQTPLLDSRFRLLEEPGTRLEARRENGAPAATVRDTADAVELSMRAHGNAAVVDESNYPVWYQPYPRAQVSRPRTWGDVVAWALPLYPRVEAPLPDDLERRIAEWRRLPTQATRLTAALRAVQDEVRYFGVEIDDNTHRPAAPADSWRRRRGDCKDKAYLLVTILGRLGIPAVPALTSIDEGRAVTGMIPSAYDFDHVVVRAQVDGKTLWVDPTISQQGGTAADSDLRNYGVALPVAAGASAPEAVSAPAGADAGTEIYELYRPTGDGRKVPLEIRTVYKGRAADARRAGFASERLAEVSRRYADFYRRRFGELEVSGEPRLDDDRQANVLTVVEHYVLAAPFEAEGASVEGLNVRADAIDGATALPSTMQRKGPLSFAMPGRYRHQVRVAVPQGWKPTFSAESQGVEGGHFDYRRSVDMAAGEARLDYTLQVRDQDIDAAQAAAHVTELRDVQDSLSATLRFRRPQAQADEARAKRLRDLLRGVQEGGKTP